VCMPQTGRAVWHPDTAQPAQLIPQGRPASVTVTPAALPVEQESVAAAKHRIRSPLCLRKTGSAALHKAAFLLVTQRPAGVSAWKSVEWPLLVERAAAACRAPCERDL